MIARFSVLLIIFTGCLKLTAQQELADYVNTLQGTNSKHELTRGNTYPTTALPFGMNTWTPQTGNNGDGWKYQYFKEKDFPCTYIHGKSLEQRKQIDFLQIKFLNRAE